jgi:hypothetical protein
MTTPRPDQAALCGLVQKVRDVALPLVSVTQVDLAQPRPPPSNPDSASIH